MLHDFDTKGYVIVKDFLDDLTLSTVSKYLENRVNRQEWVEVDEDKISAYKYYADPFIEVILESATAKVAEVCGREAIFPTYSFARIYQKGESLFPHVDRPSCEISVTVNVANLGEPSPIFMKYDTNEEVKCVLSPGDAVVYKGCEVEHWRNPLIEGQLVVQFMLHYVDAHGDFARHRLDARPKLGLGTETIEFKF